MAATATRVLMSFETTVELGPAAPMHYNVDISPFITRM